jgi:outer membrane lipoprotein carrier protein
LRAQEAPPGNAPAQDAEPPPAAASALERFVAEVDDLSARFEQRELDSDGMLIEMSVGQFQLLRPGRYLWHYEPPYEQLFVADGETLWWYEVDVEQATCAPLAEWSSAPHALLSGEAAVSDAYSIHELPADDGADWIELLPKESEPEFRSAKIAFRDGVPSTLELIDALGELTRIEFSEVEVNAGLDPGAFDFTPPRGVDVVCSD